MSIFKQGDVVKVYEIHELDFDLVMIGVVIKAYPDQRYYIASLTDIVPRSTKAGWGRYGIDKDTGLYIDNQKRNHHYFLTKYERASVTCQSYVINTTETLFNKKGQVYPKWMGCPSKQVNFYQGVVDVPTGYYLQHTDEFNPRYTNPVPFTFTTLTVNGDEIGEFSIEGNKRKDRTQAYYSLMSKYYERKLY